MLYGSLYKVFLRLSNPKNTTKNNFNELTIPKIFVKILLNKEKKNLNHFYPNDSNELIKDHHVFEFNNDKKFKVRKFKNKSLNKNNYLTNLGLSLPKIKITNDIPLIGKKENSESKRKIKKDFIINDSCKQIKKGNESLSLDFSKKIYINRNNNIRKIKIPKIDETNKNNDFSSYNNSNKKEMVKNLKYTIKLKKLFGYRYLENKADENENDRFYEGEFKEEFNENILKPKYNSKNIIKLINDEQGSDYKGRNKSKIKLSKISLNDKEKDCEYHVSSKIKLKKPFKLKKQKTEFLINAKTTSKKYEKIEDISNSLTKKEIEYDFNKNIFSYTDIFYFKCKMYKNQIKEYFSHRINWKILSNNNNDNTINFEWKYYSNRLNYKEYKYDSSVPLKKLRMVNLFEKNYEIGNKKNMFINLINYCDKKNINVFEIVPFTMIISNSINIQNTLNKIEKIMNLVNDNKYSKKNIISNQKYNEIFSDDKYFDSLKNQYIYIDKNYLSKKNYWIIKPPDLYQGKCIEICDSFEEFIKIAKKIFRGVDKKIIPEQLDTFLKCDNNDSIYNNEKLLTLNNYMNSTNYNINSNPKKKFIRSRIYSSNEIIVQKYLDNPLLYKNRKFDIRCFVLLDSNFNLFFCREGHLKGSSELYNLNNANKYIHITNHSLQKNSNNFELYEIGNEMSYKDFKNYLVAEKIPLEKFDYMINQMKSLIKISFKSVSKKLLKESNVLCFEIFGYDFILDNDFKLWILEINNNPGLSISSPVIEKLVPRMMDDAFRLTIDKVFNTIYAKECIDQEGRYKTRYTLNGFSDDENIFEFLCNIK